jgi:hypothetical protein
VVQKSKEFSGALDKVDTGDREWKGEKYPTVKVSLIDGDEKYVLDLSFSILTRSVFNSLLGLESYENLKFTIYLTKPNPAKNNARYPQISVWQNDELVKWKFTKDELPKEEEIKDSRGKVIKRDSIELDEFYVKAIKEKFSGKTTVPAKKADPTPAPTGKKTTKPKTQPVDDQEDSSEIPF